MDQRLVISANHGATSWETRHGEKTLTVSCASWETSTLKFQSGLEGANAGYCTQM